MSRMVSFVVLLGVIAVIGFLFYRVISGFIIPMFIALLLVVMFRPWHAQFLKWCRGQTHLAALLTTASVLLVAVLPAVLLVFLVGWELFGVGPLPTDPRDAARKPVSIDVVLKQRLAELRVSLGLKMPYVAELRYVEESLKSLQARAATGATYQGDDRAFDNLAASLRDLREKLEDDGETAALDDIDAIIATLTTPATSQELQPGTFGYQRLIGQAVDQFRTFKVALLGGPLQVWLADLANPTDAELRSWTGRLSTLAPGVLRSVGGATGTFVANLLFGLLITTVSLYFFLADGPYMVQALMHLSPLDEDHERELIAEFDVVVRAVVLATLLSAVAQGILAGIGFWVLSLFVENFRMVFTLTLLTTIVALVPFVGAASVWVPVAIWLFFQQEYACAVVLVIYGTGVISTADNVIKPWVLHGQSNLHPLLALLSVLGGVQTLGPIGILIGPMVVVFLQILLNILHREVLAREAPSNQPSHRDGLPLVLSLRQRGLRLPFAAATRNRRA